MNYYNQGGLADIAQNLANKGRNGDTKLVHMSPKEVRGLQALAKANGTSLTINPDTGLPEAFRLENLIPMAAGAALTATGVGAPLAALMVGGAYGAATGSIEKGLMAGIGAYGGAGLTTGLTSAATQGATEASAANALGVPGAATGAGSQASTLAAQNASMGLTPLESAANISSSAGYAAGATPMSMGSQAADLASSGIGNLGTSAGRSAAYSAMPTGTLPATAVGLLAQPTQTSSAPGYQEDEYDRRLKGYRISPNYQPYVAQPPNPYYRPVYAADGGMMSSFDDEPGKDMAHGGVASLGGYSDGGRMLKGPGDGMSDSIPGVIGGKQPARLADGEFVVPADVVSHLGNGSTDAGAKRLYSMMDKIRQARTGKKKQAPEVNAEKYLPVKKASGGIAGYASGGVVGYATGGEVAALYDSVLGRTPDAAGLEYWTNSGLSTAEIAKALAASPEARTNQVQQIFNQQLGRGAEQTAVDFYSKALASGQSLADVSKGIAQSLEGQKLDKQGITSVFRQVLGRNPEPAGQQYWLSVAQNEGLTTDQLKDRITSAANVEREARKIAPGEKFTQMQLDALGSDPFGGYYSEKSIYDIAPDAKNVSMIGNRQVQFATPVTQQAVVSKFIDGVYTANPGVDIVNEPHIQAAINVARANGTLSESAFNNITSALKTAKTPAETRAILAAPQATVIVDALYGQQIGENFNLDAAKAEAVGRQRVLSEQDPGYYQSNKILTDAYRAAGLTVPFEYDFYKDVDTRDRASNVVTPENFQQKQNSLINSLNRNNPYRVNYQPLTRGIANMPDSVQDPYSDAGLQFLYGQMMNQYAPPPAGFVNPATFVSNPFTYIPPPPNNLVLAKPVADAANPAPAPAPAPVVNSGGGDGGGG